jgi:hypothetical protein
LPSELRERISNAEIVVEDELPPVSGCSASSQAQRIGSSFGVRTSGKAGAAAH